MEATEKVATEQTKRIVHPSHHTITSYGSSSLLIRCVRCGMTDDGSGCGELTEPCTCAQATQ